MNSTKKNKKKNFELFLQYIKQIHQIRINFITTEL